VDFFESINKKLIINTHKPITMSKLLNEHLPQENIVTSNTLLERCLPFLAIREMTTKTPMRCHFAPMR
jgi:hypothetical protein